MHWSGGQDRLTEEQVALVKSQLRRETDQLLRAYAVYLSALKADQGEPPPASTIQYFVEAWRELRHRKRAPPAQS